METNYTPGPWEVCGGYTPRYTSIKSSKGYIVYEIGDYHSHIEHGKVIKAPCYDEQHANARLIASSPDMVEALKECLDVLSKLAQTAKIKGERESENYAMHGVECAKQAINKALGE